MQMTDKTIHFTTYNLLTWWWLTELSISQQLTCWRDADDWHNYPFHDRQQTIKLLLTFEPKIITRYHVSKSLNVVKVLHFDFLFCFSRHWHMCLFNCLLFKRQLNLSVIIWLFVVYREMDSCVSHQHHVSKLTVV
jgi:hypothetical protein